MITKEKYADGIKELEAQKANLLANLNAIEGAIMDRKRVLEEWDKPEEPKPE